MAAYHKVEVSLNANSVEVGAPSPQTVNVVLPLVGPAGPTGAAGATGATGAAGAPGQGVPVGGTTGQVLRKASGTNYDTEWATGGGGVSSWNDLTDKPSEFPPEAHTHVLADITDAGTAAASDTTDFAAAVHTHTASDIDSGVASNGHVLTADGSGGSSFAALPASGIGGSTGATDNAILRADGTGGSTAQAADIVVDDATTSTQANVAVRNNHSETNSALVLTPKGTGAFIVGPKPDGTSTGGSARGSGAIDIQPSGRTSANQVASGTQAIAIGAVARASGPSAIAIGVNTVASGGGATAVGETASASGTWSTSLGQNPSASAEAAVAIGRLASASGLYSAAILNSASLRGMFSVRPFNAVYWGGQTTDATANVELNLDATATNRMTIAANTMAVADLWIAANSTGSNKAMFCRRMVAIRRDNANNTVLVGAVQTVGNDQFHNAPTWSVLIDADDTNEALRVRVTGAASETVTWRVTAFYRVV